MKQHIGDYFAALGFGAIILGVAAGVLATLGWLASQAISLLSV